MPFTSDAAPPGGNPRSLASAWLIVAIPLINFSLLAQEFSHPDTQPAPETALIQRANDALAAGDLPAALKILTDLNTQAPHNALVLYDLGLTLEAIDASPTANPPTPVSHLSAETCYRQAIETDPSLSAPHVALGLLLARTDHLAEARTQLTAATSLPDIAPALKAHALRALARLDLGSPGQRSPERNPAAASTELLAALALTPEQPEDILLSGEIAEVAGDFPAAEGAYRRYLTLPANTNAPQATAALAHVLVAEHHTDEAEALLSAALSRAPSDPGFTAQLAQAYLSSGDDAKIAKAPPLLERLHTDRPADANISRLLARVYLETGHPNQAETLYAALIAEQTTHPDPTLLDDRAEALIRLHRPGEAEKLLKQAVANPSAFPSPSALGDAATHLALAASEMDDPRMTLQALALRATVQQPSPSSLFLEATANDDLHQTAKAADLYKKFLTAAGGTLPEQESQARQRLAALQHTK